MPTTSSLADALSRSSAIGDSLGDVLHRLALSATGFDSFEEGYSSLLRHGNATVSKVNGTAVVEEFSKRLQQKLESKTAALHSIKEEAEKLHQNHTYDPNIEAFQFFNSKDLELAGHPVTKKLVKFAPEQLVNLSMSSMQIPTNVYDRSAPILNAASWIKKMDPVYISNFKTHPSLLWQYFCIPLGVFDIYPGYPWPNPTADRYDCRRRSWYIQGMSSQKDMVITIDMSGSMTGKNVAIATVAAHQIVASLQENDFFNIVLYNTKTTVLLGNGRQLLQASRANKERAYDALANLPKPGGPVDVGIGLDEAFALLNLARSSAYSTSGCHQIISILTDGMENNSTVKEIYKSHSNNNNNNNNNRTRIFTYQLGIYQSLPATLMKWLSCRSRGKYYSIETAGDIWDKILDYVTVLGRPMAMHDDSSGPFYVPIYLDFGGAGMVTSLVSPAFSNKTGPEVVAVLGQDISIAELNNTSPIHEVGPNGLSFSVNNNGFVLIHPDIKGQLGHLQDPPTVLLPHLVHANINETNKLMMGMIDRRTGEVEFETAILSPRFNEERMHVVNATYYYTPTNNTPFSCTIVLPSYNAHRLKWNEDPVRIKRGLSRLKDSTITHIRLMAPWPYCDFKEQFPNVDSLRLAELNSNLSLILMMTKRLQLPSSCNTMLAISFLSFLDATEAMISHAWNETFNRRNNVSLSFVSTPAGYTAYLSTAADSVGRLATQEPFYERAAEAHSQARGHFVYHTAVTQDGAWCVEATSPVMIGNPRIISAVVGYRMNIAVLREMLTTVVESVVNSTMEDDSHQPAVYYLVDTTAFVMASTKDSGLHTGEFFGEVEGLLVRDMLKNLVLERRYFADRQADCPQQRSQQSDATRPQQTVLAAAIGAASALISFASSVGAALGLLHLMPHSTNSFVASSNVKPVANVSCVKQMAFYAINQSAIPYAGSLHFGPCEKAYAVVSIHSSNLVLVSTSIDDEACKAHRWPLTRDPVKIEDEPNSQHTFYRRPLDSCVRFHPDEFAADCPGLGRSLAPGYYPITLALSAYSVWILSSTSA